MPVTRIPHTFYGFQLIQNPSNTRMILYVGAIDANIIKHVVSVDNSVRWNAASEDWVERGRNRAIIDKHWKSIRDFLSASNNERILPSPIIISVEADSFNFEPFDSMPTISRVTPGRITITGRYDSDEHGISQPVEEGERSAWVLDGQHRITAFRNWTMPDPYPINVVIIPAWRGGDFEDTMRHQTYELNMGRPLDDDFKAAIRESYHAQMGHAEYKQEIALSWIRKNIEGRGRVFNTRIVGAPRLRTPYIIRMSTLENILSYAFDNDDYLKTTYQLDNLSLAQAAEVGKYLFDFYEGVRLSIGVINPHIKGTIGTEPEVDAAIDYWDIANTHKQRLLHNVGLKAVTKALLHKVMRDGGSQPQSPIEVAEKLEHMKGIPWHHEQFISCKDDWVNAIAEALMVMYESDGTGSIDRRGERRRSNRRYTMTIQKRDEYHNPIGDSKTIHANGW
jgi:hypothetical protein